MKSKTKNFFSIAIPFYFRDENSLNQLYRCINSIKKQTFKDYEIIVSTQNVYERLKNDSILIEANVNLLNAENVKGFIQGNINNAIERSKGKWIKILFSDDFFFDKFTLKNIYSQVKQGYLNWAVMNSLHFDQSSKKFFKPIIPYFQNSILDINTIGSPSSIIIRNSRKILFDEKSWFRLDVDYYLSLFKKFGKPSYIKDVYIVNEIHNKQFSSIMLKRNLSINLKLKEESQYLSLKHNYRKINFFKFLYLRIIVKSERIFLSILFNTFHKRFNNVFNFIFKLRFKKYYQ